ncbi:MAG: hypothetical protein U0O43_04380 [Clostridia bacterium]|jgi:hypothetical protein
MNIKDMAKGFVQVMTMLLMVIAIIITKMTKNMPQVSVIISFVIVMLCLLNLFLAEDRKIIKFYLVCLTGWVAITLLNVITLV